MAFVQCKFEGQRGRGGVGRGSNEWATSGYEAGPPPSDGGEERPTKGPPDGKGFEYIYACIRRGEGRQGGEICAIVGWASMEDMVGNDDGKYAVC